MMASLVPALVTWGVRPDDIHHEAFGPASTRPAQASPRARVPPASPPLEITFRKNGRTLAWEREDANLLEFAERHGLSIESGCRSGSCGTCEVRLVSGTVSYAGTPDYELAPGHCLLCVGFPETDVELEA
jgi:ferredoxin